MTKPKSSKVLKEVSDASIAIVGRIVRQLETKQLAGTLTKDAYKAAVVDAKKAVGKDWSDVAEAIENFDPKKR